ncbi:MAG: helix-turn-helix transcriptional regulator [Burkholderiaceae bacterium]|jgi:DNA-binding transcriptional regulator YiaG|nr:helix-turn-helix transcriptional regulator [Burkholderiaceae bacterium]MDP3136752.1 helix-turn-helix transcriptional regulator [Burkholderiaceae bacterium]
MTDLAGAIKSETARIARKQIRAEVQGMRKATAQHRSDIAALKRRVQHLEQMVKRLAKAAPMRQAVAKSPDEPKAALRFSAKGFAAHRKRLGLSAADMGLLLGVSGQSVYKWEDGKARPQSRQLSVIASVRALSKKQALAHLETLRPAE